MQKKNLLFALVLCGTLAMTTLYGDSGKGNGAGTSNNCENKVKIYHLHGNGTYMLMHVPAAALQGHAAHGDLWYQSGCPLTGSEYSCW